MVAVSFGCGGGQWVRWENRVVDPSGTRHGGTCNEHCPVHYIHCILYFRMSSVCIVYGEECSVWQKPVQFLPRALGWMNPCSLYLGSDRPAYLVHTTQQAYVLWVLCGVQSAAQSMDCPVCICVQCSLMCILHWYYCQY